MRHRGFTLIELLVVIAIIGVLSAIVLTSINVVRMKSRDARRISDMHTIQVALEMYYDDYGRYPNSDRDASDPAPGSTCSTWDCSQYNPPADCSLPSGGICPGNKFLEVLQPKYLTDPPLDPLNNNTYFYRYLRTAAGLWGPCPAGPQRYYLQIKNFEILTSYRNPNFCGAGLSADWTDGRQE